MKTESYYGVKQSSIRIEQHYSDRKFTDCHGYFPMTLLNESTENKSQKMVAKHFKIHFMQKKKKSLETSTWDNKKSRDNHLEITEKKSLKMSLKKIH